MADLPTLPDDHRVWNLAAYYIGAARGRGALVVAVFLTCPLPPAQLCVTLCLTLCPQRIVMGGGLLNRECVLPLVRSHFVKLLNGYVRSEWVDDVERYIVRSKFGPTAGLVGALHLATTAHAANEKSTQ